MKIVCVIASTILSLISGPALAGEVTVMKVPGEVSSGDSAQVVVIKVKKAHFEAMKDQDEALIAGELVHELQPSSSDVLEGRTEDGRPTVVLKVSK